MSQLSIRPAEQNTAPEIYYFKPNHPNIMINTILKINAISLVVLATSFTVSIFSLTKLKPFIKCFLVPTFTVAISSLIGASFIITFDLLTKKAIMNKHNEQIKQIIIHEIERAKEEFQEIVSSLQSQKDEFFTQKHLDILLKPFFQINLNLQTKELLSSFILSDLCEKNLMEQKTTETSDDRSIKIKNTSLIPSDNVNLSEVLEIFEQPEYDYFTLAKSLQGIKVDLNKDMKTRFQGFIKR